ncbi:MAG: ferric reductase-like transmembrane domain-containing protein, partial [Granulosicoccus sp.]|nr:ferric reductase-like transmembrane domain-containing protein [Granulosicoccus sp.]
GSLVSTLKKVLSWVSVAAVVVTPLGIAATSPLLAWREPIYIAAGFAGVIAMSLLFVQPLLVGGYLPGLAGLRGRRIHRWVGLMLVVTIVLHVVGLWITSPPDVIDALLFRSPTPFSVWGVIAMWAAFTATLLAVLRKRMAKQLTQWRFAHTLSAAVVVIGSVVHALQIDGTMGTISKIMLCLLVMSATLWAIVKLRSWGLLFRRRS